jgi:hypothetical protein
MTKPQRLQNAKFNSVLADADARCEICDTDANVFTCDSDFGPLTIDLCLDCIDYDYDPAN